MTIAALIVAMAALAALLVWWTAERARDYFVIAVLAFLLSPLLVMGLTGDLSRYFPGSFSDGPEGVGEIILAGFLSTFVIAVILAACVWWCLRLCWRRFA